MSMSSSTRATISITALRQIAKRWLTIAVSVLALPSTRKE